MVATVRARIDTLIVVVLTALNNVEAPELGIEPDSTSARFLAALEQGAERNGTTLATELGVDLTEVSRTGGRLAGRGLVRHSRAGREAYWRLTPLGAQAAATARRRAEEKRKERAGLARPGADERAERFRRAPRPPRRRGTLPDLARPADLVRLSLDEGSRPQGLVAQLFMWESFQEFAGTCPPKLHVPREVAPKRVWHDLESELQRDLRLESIWPATPPSWDGYAVVTNEEGRQGVVLFDVPRGPKAIFSQTSRFERTEPARKARSAVHETFKHLNLPEPRIEASAFPDMARRLVVLYFLRVHCDVEAWMLRMCVVAPRDTDAPEELPTSRDRWENAHLEACSQLHIKPEPLRTYWRQHYILADAVYEHG